MKSIRVPVRENFRKANWGDLTVFADTHIIVGEKVKKLDESYSFIGGHRVRRFRFKNKVFFQIPKGTELDISAVPAGQAPPRRRQNP